MFKKKKRQYFFYIALRIAILKFSPSFLMLHLNSLQQFCCGSIFMSLEHFNLMSFECYRILLLSMFPSPYLHIFKEEFFQNHPVFVLQASPVSYQLCCPRSCTFLVYTSFAGHSPRYSRFNNAFEVVSFNNNTIIFLKKWCLCASR